jgi:hypothetical protein
MPRRHPAMGHHLPPFLLIMPFGISNPLLGYGAYCVVKFIGYSFAVHSISRNYQTAINPFFVGGIRTLIGMGVGVAYFFILQWLWPEADALLPIGLVPVRLAEWWLLLWLFYDRQLEQRKKGWKTVVFSTIWSFFLDVPAMIGFFVTGGISVC